MNRLAVLVSGAGSILEAMIDYGLPISLVIADRSCQGLTLGKDAGIKTLLVQRTSFGPDFDRVQFSQMLVDELRANKITHVAMAGFMTVLAQPIFDAYEGKIYNTHPSLLPAFRGGHAVESALAYGVKVTGCTIHVATLDLDNGPIVARSVVEVRGDDTVSSLHERIKQEERRLYPQVLKHLLEL